LKPSKEWIEEACRVRAMLADEPNGAEAGMVT
jgi:hypothetical protein